MRILVLSDTHGEISRARAVCEKLQTQSPLDLIVHCGDYYKDAIKLGEVTGVPIVWVKGNTDGSFSPDEVQIVETEYGDLLVTHGHMENVEFSMQKLFYRAQEKNCCAALFGHTHRAVFTETGGIYLMNPGSLTKPRDGSGGTFGLLTTGADYLSGRIYRYAAFMEKPDNGNDTSGSTSGGKRTGVQGGYLRKLLNYSDRF